MKQKIQKVFPNKKVWLIFGMIIMFFLIYNIIWFFNYKSYGSISDDYEKFDGMYVKEDKRKFDYTWSYPKYLSFTGNYAITNEDDTLSLIIWPKSLLKKESRFGLQIYSKVKKEGYMFYIDREMNYLYPENIDFSEKQEEEILKLMKAHETEIKDLMELADKEWEI